jgi:hypothetical protein
MPAPRPRFLYLDLDNFIEVAEFGPGEEVAPFIHRKFADRAFGVTGIADEYVFSATRHPHTCTAFAGAGDMPTEISRIRCICRHERPFVFE